MATLVGLIAGLAAMAGVALAFVIVLVLLGLDHYNGPGSHAIIYGVIGASLGVCYWVADNVKSRIRNKQASRRAFEATTDDPQPPKEARHSGRKSYDSEKWNALLKYDEDIARAADQLRGFGEKWVDVFAQDFLALNDKKYLPSIVQKIIVEAKKTKAEEQSRQGAGEQNENSHTSEQQQQSPKAEKKGASAYRTAMLVALGGVALAVVGAVELSRTWSLHEKLLTAQTEALKKLPIKYRGGNITLVDMQVGYLGITYVNTVADEGRAQFDSQLTVLKSDVRKGICASEDMKAMLNSGASYSYEYRDQIGNVIFGFAVDSCP